MITHSDTITKLMQAMLEVQGAVDGVKKDSTNPHFKNRYASLESVIDTLRPHWQKNGLVVIQAPGEVIDGALSITTMVTHAESGEWLKSTMHLPLGKQDPQGAGSATTYGQRYSLMSVHQLPPIDDDAEAATGRNSAVKPKSAYRARKDGDYEPLQREMREQKTVESLKEWAAANKERIGALPDGWQDTLRAEYEDQILELRSLGIA